MIYLDYAATTPTDARVLEAMRPFFSDQFGNPSSTHAYGQQAEAAVETSREIVAEILGCRPGEVVFTSCGTEADNLALRGSAIAMRARKGANRLVLSHAEHPAVSKTAEALERWLGFEVRWIEATADGTITPDAVAGAIDDKTAVVSVMYANNEIGTINPIREIGEICRARSVPFHTDAVQAAAYLPVDVEALAVDLLALGAHKLYGPKGVGALYVRSGTDLVPHLTGGGQEFGLRSGTQNVPYIVGLAAALRLAEKERIARIDHVMPLRNRLIGAVLESATDVRLTGHLERRLPNHASFVFLGADGNLLANLLNARGFACSSGSACKTGSPEPSDVMEAIGLPRDWGLGSLRLTLGTGTTAEDIDGVLRALPESLEKARSLHTYRSGASR